MTDNDIIKALEHCIKCNQRQIANCNGCLFERIYPECDTEIEVMCLDLINRQKAEIERLQKYNTENNIGKTAFFDCREAEAALAERMNE